MGTWNSVTESDHCLESGSFWKKSLGSRSEHHNTMVTSCYTKLWIPSALRTTSKHATAQGIQLIWEWTLNWAGFSCCLCWGYNPVLPWWKLVIYKVVVVVMWICARWIPSRHKFLRKEMMLHAKLLIPFCPWVGLCSINWFLVLVVMIDGPLAKTTDQILSF